MSTLDFPAATGGKTNSWLTKPILRKTPTSSSVLAKWQITPAALLLSAILLLSIGLHFYNLQSIGNANSYYTAAVKSMLTSWHNFFFVAAEPGGGSGSTLYLCQKSSYTGHLNAKYAASA